MASKGFSHVGLATHDLERTREFYEGVLGFKAIAYDVIELKEGGEVHHLILDVGHEQAVAFMEPRGLDGIPAGFDAGINGGLGVPSAFYHFAFEAGDAHGLEQRRRDLVARGVSVSEVIEHGFARSIYFKDPNGLQLEFCYTTRDAEQGDAVPRARLRARFRDLFLP
jgi:glyoxylase I family protein